MVSTQAMRFLGIGHSSDLGDMYLRLAALGHEVRVYSRDLAEHGVLTGLLDYVDSWEKQLAWIREAGPEGVILFETAEHGAVQDQLRREGFQVIGGSELGDRLENDRAFGQRALASLGLRTVPTYAFDDFERAIAFVQSHPRRYVFKLDGSETSSWRNYVGRSADGSDVVALLRGQRARLAGVGLHNASFVLMEHVTGVETGVGAYFNGREFLEPVCLDWEHKRFFPDDLGELTGEMGTLLTYRNADRLFAATLAKLAPLLGESGYVGYINLNTIVNEDGVWPLELTCRFGYPGFAILDVLQTEGWAPLFKRMLCRDGLHFETASGFAVGVVLTVPPFPYRYGYAEVSRGLPIAFDASLTPSERDRLHFAEVALDASGQLIASGIQGCLMIATGAGPSAQAARKHAYELAERVFVPNIRYRTDVGAAYISRDEALLMRLGFLPQVAP
jgi:phosphoribosylamine--glycine ligase